MIFEKSSWKNQVRQTGFLVYFELEFYCLWCSLQKLISKLIFAGYTGSKNQVRNRLKIQFVELDFSKLIFQKSSTDQQGVTRDPEKITQPNLAHFLKIGLMGSLTPY